MSDKRVVKPVALAVGAALAGSFALGGVASADTADNPFQMTALSAGYMLGAGEGSCGGDKVAKEGEGTCGEGSCGGNKEGATHADKAGEGTCGEGTCGGDKEGATHADKAGEGACGEGTCGGDKKGATHVDKDAEATCGGDKAESAEGKCGEGSCGGVQ